MSVFRSLLAGLCADTCQGFRRHVEPGIHNGIQRDGRLAGPTRAAKEVARTDPVVFEGVRQRPGDMILRHHLIDGQGNWGSLDGDSPAAMRYTECRLTQYSKLLLEEIDRGTVDFRPNYDGNEDDVDDILDNMAHYHLAMIINMFIPRADII